MAEGDLPSDATTGAGSAGPDDVGRKDSAVRDQQDGPDESTTGSDIDLSKTVAELTDEDLDRTTRIRLLGRVIRDEIRKRGVKDLLRPKAAVRWGVDAVTGGAPHGPIRGRQA